MDTKTNQPMPQQGYPNQQMPQQNVTNVYIQQPTTSVYNKMSSKPYVLDNHRDWTFDLCDCCNDVHGCMCALFLTPCYQYILFTEANEGLFDCLFSSLSILRTKVRTQRGITGSICDDVCVSTWLPWCVMVQIANEIKNTPIPTQSVDI